MKHSYLTAIASLLMLMEAPSAIASMDAKNGRLVTPSLKEAGFLPSLKGDRTYKASHTKLISGQRSNSPLSTYTLSITLDADPEQYEPIWTQIVGKDNFFDGVWHDLNDPDYVTASTELPAGEYCVVSHLRKIDPTVMFSQGADVLIVKGLNLVEDTSLTLNADWATNSIKGSFFIPDGAEAMLPTDYYPMDGEYQHLDGNINFLQVNSTLTHKDFGYLYGLIVESEFEALGEDPDYTGLDMKKRCTIWINDLDDDFCLTQFRLASTDSDGFYFSEMKPIWGISESMDAEFSKDYSTTYTVDGVRSLSGEESIEEGFEPLYDCNVYSILPNYSSNRGVKFSSSPKFWLAGALQANNPVEHLFSVAYSDFQETVYDEEYPDEELGTMTYFTRTMPLKFNLVGSVETVYTPLIGNYSETADKLEDSFICSPTLSFDNIECRQRLGDSQPTMSFLSYEDYDWDLEKDVWMISALPIGRLGEFRAGDTVVTDWKETEEIVDGVELTTMGVSVSNQMVDGIRGVTTASFTLDPEKTIAPPVLRQLQFRNSEGIVTDRFDSADEGRFLISTATYTQDSDPEETWNWWYDVTPCTTKVSVSPYGEQKWIEVELEELPEDYVAAFGNLYSGSLASVEAKSANGWYDMKVELASADGAVSSQIVSPAFKIGEGAGIGAIANDGLRIVSDGRRVYVPGEPTAELTVYNMDGRAVATGVGELKLASLHKGIYLVRAGEYSVKIAI